jgi:ribosome-interacting GTPase 1
MGILEKIADIEKEIAKTQKNKATEHHLGVLKGKLAKYRTMLLEPVGKQGVKGAGFDVVRQYVTSYFYPNCESNSLNRISQLNYIFLNF